MAGFSLTQEFHDAVSSNDETKIEALLSTIDFATLDGLTALDIVIKYDQHTPTVQKMIEAGVDVNDAELGLPLITAIKQGSVELVQLLLASGADMFKSDGQTNALACAIDDTKNTNSLIIVQLLKQYDLLGNQGDGDNRARALYAACCIGDVDRVKQYCKDEGMTIASCHHLQLYPLMKACASDQTDLVKCLLEQGADVDEENSYGETALGLCIFRGNSEILQILLQNGADIHKEVTRQYWGLSQRLTPLMWACFKQKQIIEILLANGADVNVVSSDTLQTTALHLTSKSARDNLMSGFASVDTDQGVVEELLERGARPDVNDGTGRTPLDHHIRDLSQCIYYMDSDMNFNDITKKTDNINLIIMSSKPHSISRGGTDAVDLMFLSQNASCVLNVIPICEKMRLLGNVNSFLKHLIYAGMIQPSSVLSERYTAFVNEHTGSEASAVWLSSLLHSGYSLKEQCRLELRRKMCYPLKTNIMSDDILLPPLLKRYLLLDKC